MVELIKKKWVEWLISIVLVIITVELTNYYSVKNEQQSYIQKQIEKKADTDYVNQQNTNLKYYVDRRDDNIQNLLNTYVQAQQELYKSMDNKLNILINRK
jgi:uncharacterized protein YlxW (UPF0749 family)